MNAGYAVLRESRPAYTMASLAVVARGNLGPATSFGNGGNMYTVENYRSKKQLKLAVQSGAEVRLFAPGLGTPKVNGIEFVEGPHYPQAHSWYAQVEVRDGIVVRVK